jgi:hypothetical protein
MFSRIDKIFVITTSNLLVLEAVSEWIYKMLKVSYFLQIETYQQLTIYRLCVPLRNDWDEKVKRQIIEDLKIRNLYIVETEEA